MSWRADKAACPVSISWAEAAPAIVASAKTSNVRFMTILLAKGTPAIRTSCRFNLGDFGPFRCASVCPNKNGETAFVRLHHRGRWLGGLGHGQSPFRPQCHEGA